MREEIKDGGPAFPVPNLASGPGQTGMSLRDWFAGQVAAALLVTARMKRTEDADTVATAAYLVADSMLKEREQ